MMLRGKWLVAGLLMAAAPLAGCRDNPNAKAEKAATVARLQTQLDALDAGQLWGNAPTISELAPRCNTSAYRLPCSLKRTPRVYLSV